MRYDSEFNPLLLEGQTATLFGTGLPEAGLNVECLAVGALPEHWINFGALVAGVWDTGNTVLGAGGLEMNTMELSQLRCRVVTEMKMRLNHPGSVSQWRTKSTTFALPQFPTDPGMDFLQQFYWKASEFFIYQDNTPEFDFYANRAQATSIVLFSGWRFKLLATKQPGRIKIWTSEWPSISATPRYS